MTVRPHRLRLHGRNPVQWVTGNAVAPWFLQLNPATRRRRTAMSHLLHCPCISPARIGPTRSGARTHHCATVAAAPAHRLEPPRVAPGRGATGAPVVSARCIASFGPPRVAAGRRRGLGRLSNVRRWAAPASKPHRQMTGIPHGQNGRRVQSSRCECAATHPPRLDHTGPCCGATSRCPRQQPRLVGFEGVGVAD